MVVQAAVPNGPRAILTDRDSCWLLRPPGLVGPTWAERVVGRRAVACLHSMQAKAQLSSFKATTTVVLSLASLE